MALQPCSQTVAADSSAPLCSLTVVKVSGRLSSKEAKQGMIYSLFQAVKKRKKKKKESIKQNDQATDLKQGKELVLLYTVLS